MKCKCGHTKTKHGPKGDRWCAGLWADDTTFCDCDQFEVELTVRKKHWAQQ